jgi:hypothetical protein
VLPAGARACASLATVAFPGSGYNVGRVSVLLPAPGVVQVAAGRNLQNVYGYYLGTVGQPGRRPARGADLGEPLARGAPRPLDAARRPGPLEG